MFFSRSPMFDPSDRYTMVIARAASRQSEAIITGQPRATPFAQPKIESRHVYSQKCTSFQCEVTPCVGLLVALAETLKIAVTTAAVVVAGLEAAAFRLASAAFWCCSSSASYSNAI